MSERPILFQGAMIRALLAGTKTQTRRVVKLKGRDPSANKPGVHAPIAPYTNGKGSWNFVLAETGHGLGDPFPCPYGVPGDQLWVRETWAQNEDQVSETVMNTSMMYRADGEQRALDNGGEKPWKPSIHMSRWASRIQLEVTDVRVQRLQEISEADAIAEGIHKPVGSQFWHSNDLAHLWDGGGGLPGETPQNAYRNLWERINGAGSWEANPWCWAVTFKRVKP